jgi:hypothetical protein
MYGKNCSKGCLSGGNFQEREENAGVFERASEGAGERK